MVAVLWENSHLRVYNIYRPVSHTDGSAGDNTVWAIQRKLLQDDEIDDDPRSHIISSLVQDIKNDLKQNRLVIIAGDFNQDIFKPSLNNVFSDVGLINVASIFTPNMNARSHCRGSKLIDGVWVSKPVADTILSFGYVPLQFVIPSDHRGFYMDLDVFRILDDYFPRK